MPLFIKRLAAWILHDEIEATYNSVMELEDELFRLQRTLSSIEALVETS